MRARRARRRSFVGRLQLGDPDDESVPEVNVNAKSKKKSSSIMRSTSSLQSDRSGSRGGAGTFLRRINR